MKRMKLKNKRKQRKIILKLLIIIFLFSFSFVFTLRYFSNNISNEKFLKLLLSEGSAYIDNNTNNDNIFSKIITLVTKIDIKEPTTLLKNNYRGDSFYTSLEEITYDNTNPTSNYIKDPYEEKEITNPIIYLYNTHQSEEYASSNSQSYNINPTVMMTSYILREKLNNGGLNTIVEENDVTEFLRTNNWSYSSSYKVTRLLMEDAYSKNPSLEYFIDLHRDSVKKDKSSVTIAGNNYAKILFIVGLENENYQKNLELTEVLNDMLNEMYPGLSRGIYKKKGKGVNGVYNQDFNPNTILIEVGGVDNTIDEVYNTCEAISTILIKYIKGDSNEE